MQNANKSFVFLVSSFVLNLVSPHLPLLPHAQPRAALLFSSNRQRRGESSAVLVVVVLVVRALVSSLAALVAT